MCTILPITASFLFHQFLSIDALGVLVTDHHLNVNPIATYGTVGLKGCARQCARRRGHCVSVNYERVQLLCHLLDKNTSSSSGDLRPKVGVIYSEIDTWTTTELGEQCGSVRCGADQVCLVLSSGAVTCQLDPTGCPVGRYFNGSGCHLCGEDEYQPTWGQFNSSVCHSGDGDEWRKPNQERSICQGCWVYIGTYTEGNDTAQLSYHSVADRNECFSLCKAQAGCLAIKTTIPGLQCTLFASKSWKYGYVYDSIIILVSSHCRP